MSHSNTQQLISQAFAFHQAGQLHEAENLYRRILDRAADNFQVLSLLGMVRMQQGDWEGGCALLNASLRINPAQPDVLSNHGYALQMLENYDEALASYDRAIALYPAHASAYYNRANTLQQMGRDEAALDSFRKALELRPDHVDACVHMGNIFGRLGRHEDAYASYLKASYRRPDDPGIFNNIGMSLKELGRYREALDYFGKALALKPDYVDACINRAALLQEMGREEEALSCYNMVIELQPGHQDAYCLRGRILQSMGRYDEALASYGTILAADPGNTMALTHVGALHMERGNKAEACGSLISALKNDPECAEAYYNLAILGHYLENRELLGEFERLYDRRAALPEGSRLYLEFAMGKVLEEAGSFDEAFAAYEAGNKLYHQAHPVDEVAEDRSLDQSISFFTAELFEKCREIAASLPSISEGQMPIFIVGMPRSGTTLIEQILSCHPEVFGAGELKTFDDVTAGVRLPEIDAPEWKEAMVQLRLLGSEYLERTRKLAPDVHHIADKMPGNFLHLGLLHLMLPQARIIHVVRDPRDVCFSCYTQHFSIDHPYAYSLETLGRYYLRYQRLMRHWHDVLPAGSILEVRYENMVASPEREVARLLDYLGLPWDDTCLRFHESKRAVRTASLEQVRRPLYSSSVARWRRFEKHLGPLIEALGLHD